MSDAHAPFWWLGLAKQLAAHFDGELQSYSTSRHLLSLPSKKIWQVMTSSKQLNLSVELLPQSIERMLEPRGLTFASETEILTHSLSAIQRALTLIEKTPSLASTLGALIKSVHVLHVSEPGYDVSLSDPELPFSIFLNSSQGRYAYIRTAEALIHETMHLQLSLVERFLPIAANEAAVHFSPWKRSKRPIAGLMHAPYVFQVIRQWLDSVKNTSDEARLHASKRVSEIGYEIHQLQADSYDQHLTLHGRMLLRRLLP